MKVTSPLALKTALSGLTTSSSPPLPISLPHFTQEVLISVEYTAVDGPEPLRIANIQFNNLDVIANQETVVELVGFITRVFPKKRDTQTFQQMSHATSTASILEESIDARIELTFDFHRLNVLLMRGIRDDAGEPIGRKVATLSACGAKICATVNGETAIAQGSLDGFQLLDLTPEGRTHRRIVSIGRDSLEEAPHSFFRGDMEDSSRAFEISLKRQKNPIDKPDNLDIQVRMASVWYTHSSRLLSELQSCAAEFQRYITDVARTIGAAAADAVVNQLYLHRGSLHIDPIDNDNDISCTEDYNNESCASDVKIDIILDSPVVVLPRRLDSTQVFVAHLGRISVSNEGHDIYDVNVRDMNLYSLDTATRRTTGPGVPRSEILYACNEIAEPVLHDTELRIRTVISGAIDDNEQEFNVIGFERSDHTKSSGRLEITGSVVNELSVTLTRAQYEQVLDTFASLTNGNDSETESLKKVQSRSKHLQGIDEEDVGVGTLKMDPHVRAGMFPTAARLGEPRKNESRTFKQFRLGFDLPIFTIELKRQEKMVELSFVEFTFSCEKTVPHETNVQVS